MLVSGQMSLFKQYRFLSVPGAVEHGTTLWCIFMRNVPQSRFLFPVDFLDFLGKYQHSSAIA